MYSTLTSKYSLKFKAMIQTSIVPLVEELHLSVDGSDSESRVAYRTPYKISYNRLYHENSLSRRQKYMYIPFI